METKRLPDLYSRDSKGRIKVWTIITMEGNPSTITITHGLLNGNLELESIGVSKGKNLGKSNATTPYTQALADAEGRWNHKKREGYKSLEDLGITSDGSTDTISGKYVLNYVGKESDNLEYLLDLALPQDNTDKDGNIKPMKAQPYDAKKAKFPMIAQPKLNGFRCVARLVTKKVGMFDESTVVFTSKNGLEYNLPHIAKDLLNVFTRGGKNMILDGEMYIHGYPLQKISSAVRKPNPDTIKLKFYIFDLAMPGMDQEERLNKLNSIADGSTHFRILHEGNEAKVVDAYDSILNYKVCPYILVFNDQAVQLTTDDFIKAGFEGGIFRDRDAEYAFGKRPKTMLKLKRSSDSEFLIIDVILPEDDNPQYSVLLCKNDINNEIFKATPQGDLEWRSELYTNKESLKGKMATIKFFERTEDGKPFHATVIDIRDYE